MSANTDSESRVIRGLKVLGPGLIVAATVLGPGSVTVSSRIGALMEYSVLWVMVLSAAFMITYTWMSAKIGCLNSDSLLEIVTKRYGRWLAILMGLAVFLICAGFQTGNVIGVGLALNALVGGGMLAWALAALAMSLLFLWYSRDFYKALERIMTGMVLIMMAAFVFNVFKAAPSPVDIAAGFVPGKPKIWGLVIALSATSFSVAGAAYQAYLVQAKKWGEADLKTASRSSIAGIIVLCTLSATIIITSAAVLAPKGIKVNSAVDMAAQLEPLLGSFAKALFLCGLFAASFSSYVANALVGGQFLSDGIGLGRRVDARWAKIFTTALLVFSTGIGIAFNKNPIEVLILAQATTILGVPLVAVVLILLCNDRNVVGTHTNRAPINILAMLALAWILYLSGNQFLSFLH